MTDRLEEIVGSAPNSEESKDHKYGLGEMAAMTAVYAVYSSRLFMTRHPRLFVLGGSGIALAGAIAKSKGYL